MKALKLTPKQSRCLVAVHVGWGQCFHPLAFVPDKCIRDPTAAELAAHFQAMADDLQVTHARLTCAVTMLEYAKARSLAEHALDLESSLTSEDREYGLVCLTDDAKSHAVRLLARAAELAAS